MPEGRRHLGELLYFADACGRRPLPLLVLRLLWLTAPPPPAWQPHRRQSLRNPADESAGLAPLALQPRVVRTQLLHLDVRLRSQTKHARV